MRYEDFEKVETALMKVDMARRVASMMGDELNDELSMILGEARDAIDDVFRQIKENVSPLPFE